MGDLLLTALGGLCVVHCAGTLWALGARPARQPSAWDARTGRPLRIRVDRRRRRRRAGDPRAEHLAGLRR